MPMLLQNLFKETKDHGINESDQKRMSRSCKYIKNYKLLPELTCPDPDSKLHKKDMEELLSNYHNPSLPKEFLEKSHKSVKKIFKDYCKEHHLSPKWDIIKKYAKDLHTIVAHLKHKHRRPRPKEFLGNEYDEIIDMFSPSFPSGHTATAYFFANILSSIYEKHNQEFKNLAHFIGQSRIENGVHFPTDVLYGRFIGETLANLCLEEDLHEELLEFKLDKKDAKECKNHILKKIDDKKELLYQLSDFIFRSNQIEGINLDNENCIEACKNFLSGYPINKCTDNKHIRTHLNAMVAAKKLYPIDNPYKIIKLHETFYPDVLNSGRPGVIRIDNGYSKKLGNSYSNPKDILKHLEKINYQNNDYVKHILFEWIHPFEDGNGRLGRIILLANTDFDFKNVNNFCGDKYIDYIENYISYFSEINNVL